MSKKAQNFQQYQNARYEAPAPKKRLIEPVSLDELALYQDSELENRAQFIRDEAHRRGLRPGDAEAKPFEVEMAYVSREQGIRQTRRVLHRQYLAEENSGMVDENSLPEFKATPPNWN